MAQAVDGDTAADAAPRKGAAIAPGEHAAAPHRIPLRGWSQVLHRVRRRIMADQFPLFSAGVAFFAVLSIAPVLVTALAVYGVLNTPSQAMAQLNDVADLLPQQLEEVMAGQLTSISAASATVLTVQGLVALVIALWTATAAVNYLIDALTLAYHEHESRSFRRRTMLALGFVLGGAVLLGVVLTATGIVGRAQEGAPTAVHFVVKLAIWVGMAR